MIKKTLAIIGVCLLFAGLALGVYLFNVSKQAQALDSSVTANNTNTNNNGDVPSSTCIHPHPVIELSSRVISEADTQALRVSLSNTEKKACVVNVMLDAPNFEIGAVGATKSIKLLPGSTATTVVWVLTPKKIGTFQVSVQAGADTDIAGLTVLNTLGLAAWQVQLFSMVSTFFGPMLSAPWWFEQWQRQRSRSKRA